jgi:hypothetical protein
VQPDVPLALPVREGRPRLDDLIPAGVFVGTSLLLRQQDRFLYGMRPVREGDPAPIIELTGIGGAIEPLDESYTLGVMREAREEIGCGAGKEAACRVLLRPCGRTLVVLGQDDLSWARLQGAERPAALVFRHHRTPPHQPWHPSRKGSGWLIVYLADLEGQPYPSMELPWLLWMHPEQVLRTARQDVPLRELLDAGAELVLGDAGAPPQGSRIRLTDSQEALGVALGDALPAFFQSMGAGGSVTRAKEGAE